jgi:hypothetical protein
MTDRPCPNCPRLGPDCPACAARARRLAEFVGIASYAPCAPCSAKSGAYTLCSACLHNRTIIDRLVAEVRRHGGEP